jgi:hypothetical protein
LTTKGWQFEVVYLSDAEAVAVRDDLRARGATADLKQEPGLLPLAVLLAVTIPPGAALLLPVIERVIDNWKHHGILIDARGTGEPRIVEQRDLPYGTVVTLTRAGDEVTRSDLPTEKLSDYVSGVVSSLAKSAST